MTKKSTTGVHIYLTHPWNVIQTGFMFLTWVVMGIHIELIGPTMSIIAENNHVDFNGMGSVLALRGTGYLTATIFGVFLPNIVKKHSEALLACAFILPAIAVFATPFVTSLILLCFVFFIQGIGHGLADLGGNNVLLTMWNVNVAAPLSVAHVGYGVGAMSINLLVRPFLTTEIKANIFIPYSITTVLCVLIAVGHIFFYYRTLKTRQQTSVVQQEVDYVVVSTEAVQNENVSSYSPRTCGQGSFQYGLISSILFISSIFFILGNDTTFSKFFFTFLKFDRFKISTGTASWSIILYWLLFSIGRLLTAVASAYVSVNVCLNIVWLTSFGLVVAWLVFIWLIGLSTTSLFILGALTGLAFAPIIPLTMAFFNQRLNVVPFLLALVLCGSALGMMIFPKLGGLIMNTNPNHFPTLLLGCILTSILLYITANVVYFVHQRTTTNNEEQEI